MIKIYNNFLTKEDLDKINQLEIAGKKVEKKAGVKNVMYHHSDVYWILEKLNISGTITGGNFFETPNPFQVHTDTGKISDLNGLKSTYNVVIPLSEQVDFNTVIFNQRHYGDASHFWRGSLFKYMPDPVYNLRKTDYETLEGYTNQPFDKDDYFKYLIHLPYENLFGLSIKQVVPWKIEDVLVFDSSLLHSASYFNGIKKGLSIFVSDV